MIPHSRAEAGSLSHEAALRIPDYTLLKRIGHGAYGEVWLAKGITGALRAIKLVLRSNFSEERSFEKEFAGITNYEPISRSHPALLEVLHVGRLLDPELYYYVMELADPVDKDSDVEAGPELYRAHTLSEEIRRQGRIAPGRCIEIGKALAEGLAVLHDHHLTHRDLKPSNVVFAGGRPMLADIGLVAADGKSSFVGTEGFVPPEGPGTQRADLFGLGMVLYEASSGRDRLEFPRPPADLSSEEEKKTWRGLNEIICRACDPKPERRFRDAGELAASLGRLERGVSPGSQRRRRTTLMAVGACLLLGGIGWLTLSPPWGDTGRGTGTGAAQPDRLLPDRGNAPITNPATGTQETPVTQPLPLPSTGSIKIVSSPPGAAVYRDDVLLGTTPLSLEHEPAGPVGFTLVMSGFRSHRVGGEVIGGEQLVIGDELQVWRPPVIGAVWENSLGLRFTPFQEHHVAESPVAFALVQSFTEATATGNDEAGSVEEALSADGNHAVVSLDVSVKFCDWLTRVEREKGYLGPVQRYRPGTRTELETAGLSMGNHALPQSPGDKGLLYPIVETPPHGEVRIHTRPAGAVVCAAEGGVVGRTPLTLDEVATGTVRFILRMEGYEDSEITGMVREARLLEFDVDLTRTGALLFGSPWENSLGMRFVPIGDVQVCVWETRVSDYRAFCQENAQAGFPAVDFPQEESHPVVRVTRSEARAFCKWLSEKEQAVGLLKPHQHYRLPTDREWSLAAGLANEQGDTPAVRDSDYNQKKAFPWGSDWPPPAETGNFADASAKDDPGINRVLPGYDDAFNKTAPVGSFPANDYGIHDLSGNVWEWVEDDYGKPSGFAGWGVVRGGGWSNYEESLLRTSYRNLIKPEYRDVIYGFRCVIVEEEEE